MAILEIMDSNAPENITKERELEVKKLINELPVGKTAKIEIYCKITAYRRSFYYYLDEFNDEIGIEKEKKFSFSRTENPNIWHVIRTK